MSTCSQSEDNAHSQGADYVAALLAGKALCHAGRPEVAITAKRCIDVLGVTEDSVPYGLRIATLFALLFLCGYLLCSHSLVRPLRVGADLVCNEVVDTRFTRSRGTNGVGGGVVSAIYDKSTHKLVFAL